MKSRIITTTSIIVVCTILIALLMGSTISVGKIINKAHPCQQDITNSFPCYGVYDIYAMIFLAIVMIFFVILLTIDIYRLKKR